MLASDASAQAVQLTRHRCRSARNVTALQLRLPEPPPVDAGPFDLIVLSEFVYYLTDAQRAMALGAVRDMAAERAELIAVHWRHHPSDAYLAGEQVQDEIVTQFKQWGGQHVIQHDDREFIIDVIDWGDPPSHTGRVDQAPQRLRIADSVTVTVVVEVGVTSFPAACHS